MIRAGLIAGLACAVAALPQDRPVFRATANAVLVDVTVNDGKKPIANLVPADFIVTDNGVPQTLTGADFSRIPIDVRLIFDTSGSVSEDQLKRHKRAMADISAALGPNDRADVLQFRRKPVRTTPLLAAPIAAGPDRLGPDGTVFFDGVATALITAPRAGRRQLTILLSDGVDTASFFDWPTLEHVAERSDAVVYAVSPALPKGATTTEALPPGTRLSVDKTGLMLLQRLAEVTGGRFVELQANGDIGASFLKAFDEFRQGYVLRYAPEGVTTAGWHALNVRLRGDRKYIVRARRGYDGG